MRQLSSHQTVNHERLENLQGHFLWYAALIQVKFRTNHNNRSAGVINSLSQKILPESALFAFQNVGQRPEWSAVGSQGRLQA